VAVSNCHAPNCHLTLPCFLADASSLALVAEKTNAHSDRINSVAVSPDGTKIVSGSNDGTIKAWELRDSPVGERDVVGSKDNLTAIQQAYKEGCTPLLLNGTAVASWEEVGQKLEEIEGDFTIKVWDASSLALVVEKTRPHSGSIRSVAFSLDGTKIVSGSVDKTIKVWDADSFDLIESRPGDGTAFGRDGEGVERNGATVRMMKEGGGAFYAPSPVSCVAIHGSRIAAGAQSGELYHLEVM